MAATRASTVRRGRTVKRARLPSCDRLHPSTEPIFRHYHTAHWITGKPTRRWHCLECDRYRRIKPREPKSTPKGHAHDPYGVIPLSWKPPVL